SRLSAIEEKCRPVACGSFVRRACASAFCTDWRPYLEEFSRGAGQFGVGVPNCIERALLDIRLRNECGEWVISLDGRNAFNSVRHSAFIQALPETLPGLLSYVSKVYGNTRNFLFPLDEGGTKILPSRSGVQQGDPLGPLLYFMVTHKALQQVQSVFGPQGVSSRRYQDDTPISAREINTIIIAAFEQLKPNLQDVGINLNMGKTFAATPQGHQPTPSELELLSTTGINLAPNPSGFVTLGAPVGTDYFNRAHMEEVIESSGTRALATHLSEIEDKKVAWLLNSWSLSSRLGYLVRVTPPLLAR
ncbi:unnamed protein product, partial [Choristocarpus tenellus]